MKRVNISLKHSTYFLAQQNLLSALKSSQRDKKEMPRKRLRVPPNSATKEDMLNGQFHAKKTRFEVTTSKTSFLGPNLLVRPHVVH